MSRGKFLPFVSLLAAVLMTLLGHVELVGGGAAEFCSFEQTEARALAKAAVDETSRRLALLTDGDTLDEDPSEELKRHAPSNGVSVALRSPLDSPPGGVGGSQVRRRFSRFLGGGGRVRGPPQTA